MISEACVNPFFRTQNACKGGMRPLLRLMARHLRGYVDEEKKLREALDR
jgi:hypothetical protein